MASNGDATHDVSRSSVLCHYPRSAGDRHAGKLPPGSLVRPVPLADRDVPRGVHLLTAIHGTGGVACAVLAVGSALSVEFREGLARTGGSRLMVAIFGEWTRAFLGFIAAVLVTLSYGSWQLRPYAWPLTLAVYSVGVLGSLWQVSMGILNSWAGAFVNAGVVVYATRPGVRHAYGWGAGAER